MGKAEVLMLGVETSGAVLVPDDNMARRAAETLHLKFAGILGLPLDAAR